MSVVRPYLMHWVSDMGRAVRFYRDAFGLEPRYESEFWSEIACGDASIALHPGEATGERAAMLGLYVDDAAATCAAVERAGGRVARAPEEQAHGHILAEVVDTEGNPISVAQQVRR